ncbi:glycosyltransferase [Paenibacillus gallinarum]|uniref:Glycosyltransferase n=1 Tax=Paenibacillus gallinarum TaxID=2762232 RepID=A0ABR8T2Q2_9BACL|nr:glycosyltransferase family 2 protein [Paenibacillus gallinarum]MBD7970030.1 glycosyltransferase [Paenibacillus gallinarum]
MSIPTLGVHLIVYNEEKWLEACLEQIHNMADELIIVDTGSTDRSVEIAEKYGATVIHSPWEHDFAKARNAGLVHANTDWILVLDADEQVIVGQEEIKEFLKQEEGSQCLIKLMNWTGSGPEDCILYFAPRVFRNREGYRYEGMIHEQLVQAGKGSLGEIGLNMEYGMKRSSTKIKTTSPPSICPLKVNHYGYLPAVMKSKQTAMRNLKIIQQALLLNPDDAFHLYNLGVTYCQLEDREQAREIFLNALNSCPVDAPYRATLVRDLGKLLYANHELEQARILLLTEIRQYPDYPDLHMLLGFVEKEYGMAEQAYVYFEKAVKSGLSSKNQAVAYVTEAGADSYIPLTHMADIDKRKGRASYAEDHYRSAIKVHQGYLPAISGLADLLQREGIADSSVKQILVEIIDRENPEHLHKAAYALMSCGAYEAALSILPVQSIGIEDESWARACLIQTQRKSQAIQRSQLLLEQNKGISQDLSDQPVSPCKQEQIDLAVLDWAICSWSCAEPLPQEFYRYCNEDSLFYSQIERRLLNIRQQTELEDLPQLDSGTLLQKAEMLANRAAACGQKDLLLFLKKAGLLLPRTAADLLYEYGFRLEAAEQYLEQLAKGNLLFEGMFQLAEYMYDRANYAESLALFEQAITLSRDDNRARMGAAASCLQLAKEAAVRMLNTQTAKTSENTFSTLAQDVAELTGSLQRLDDLNWKTSWDGQARRRGV